MYSHCIVGAGVTGLSLLLLLREAGANLSEVCIIDPYFDGGDLARKWTEVLSNTPWSKTFDALTAVCPSLSLEMYRRPDHSVHTPLVELAALLRDLAQGALRTATQIQSLATRAEWIEDHWLVLLRNGTSIEAKKLVLAPGAEPRGLNLPLMSVPLEIALDRGRLKKYVHPGQRVLVFGTMHSGTLVIRNLIRDCSANVTALYNTPKPFYWDRDGAYDGVKGEAAEIADAITRGDYASTLTLLPVQDTSGVIRASRAADAVVYAMGFQPRDGVELIVGGQRKSVTAYDGVTGALTEAPAAWGFGTAYPNRAPDGVHWDVSVAAFLAHMKAQLPAVL
jgi:cation diffusion facilitator CzcD-associated flavoprotein CzcO